MHSHLRRIRLTARTADSHSANKSSILLCATSQRNRFKGDSSFFVPQNCLLNPFFSFQKTFFSFLNPLRRNLILILRVFKNKKGMTLSPFPKHRSYEKDLLLCLFFSIKTETPNDLLFCQFFPLANGFNIQSAYCMTIILPSLSFNNRQ